MYFALSDSDKSEILYIGHVFGTGNQLSSVLRSVELEFVPELDKSAIFREPNIPIKRSTSVVLNIFPQGSTHQVREHRRFARKEDGWDG